jgi:hypothetical protein
MLRGVVQRLELAGRLISLVVKASALCTRLTAASFEFAEKFLRKFPVRTSVPDRTSHHQK